MNAARHLSEGDAPTVAIIRSSARYHLHAVAYQPTGEPPGTLRPYGMGRLYELEVMWGGQ